MDKVFGSFPVAHGMCTGCGACADRCPGGAVSMKPDVEGFLYPVVDTEKCNRCGLCERTCPVLHRDCPRKPLAVYAAKAKDRSLRLKSSSGGMFSLLAKNVIAEGGIVYGAGWRKPEWTVCHRPAENEDDLEELRGSKYVQSEMGNVYSAAARQLAAGRKVLFCGTPCQIAGLRRFLGREYENLIIVDIVCHGAASPLAWRKYLDRRVRDARERRGPDAGTVARLSHRHKKYGWKRFSMSMEFSVGGTYCRDLRHDPFLRGFLANLYLRPSCHNCPARDLRSGSDITLGDYWRDSGATGGFDDDLGVSLVLVNTQKGACAFDGLRGQMDLLASDLQDALRGNPVISVDVACHPQRGRAFELLSGDCDFDAEIERLLHRPLWRRIAGRVLKITRRVLGG